MLGGLKTVLTKAEAHVAEKKLDPNALLQARLYPDMFTLTRQVQIATDHAKGASARLAGAAVPSFEDNEKTFPELKARIGKTLEFIGTFKPSQIDGSEGRDISSKAGPRELNLTAETQQHQGLP